MVAASGPFLSCGTTTSEPEENCDSLVGFPFIGLQPPPIGTLVHYAIRVGDSIQLRPAVHRVDAAQRTFNPQQGWYCVTSASSPIGGVVTLSTDNTVQIRLSTTGWVRGLSEGFAVVIAASPAAPATVWISIQITR